MKTVKTISKAVSKMMLVAFLSALSCTGAIAQSCTAGFTFTINANTVTFTNTSSGATSPNYYWNFGDGSYNWSANPNPVHSYTNNGVYNVCLSYSAADSSCTSNHCDSLTITTGGGCGISVSATGTNGVVSATASGGTPPYSYLWVPGNYTTAAVTGLGVGCYSVIVTGSDSSSCQTADLVCISDSGIIDTTATGCNLIAYAYGTNPNDSTVSNGVVSVIVSGGTPPYSYLWVPGNYTTATVTGLSSGCYSVTVTSSDSLSCSAVSTACVSDSTPTGGCSAYVYFYQDSTNLLQWYAYPDVGGTAPFTYLWNFGDGSFSTLQYPSHNYASPGNYHVCLTITSADSCSSTSCDSIYRIASGGVMQYLTVISSPLGVANAEKGISSFENFPNPFDERTTIQYSLTESSDVLITIYDMVGSKVEQLVNEKQAAGEHKINWNSSAVPQGIYLLELKSDGYSKTKRLSIVH